MRRILLVQVQVNISGQRWPSLTLDSEIGEGITNRRAASRQLPRLNIVVHGSFPWSAQEGVQRIQKIKTERLPYRSSSKSLVGIANLQCAERARRAANCVQRAGSPENHMIRHVGCAWGKQRPGLLVLLCLDNKLGLFWFELLPACTYSISLLLLSGFAITPISWLFRCFTTDGCLRFRSPTGLVPASAQRDSLPLPNESLNFDNLTQWLMTR